MCHSTPRYPRKSPILQISKQEYQDRAQRLTDAVTAAGLDTFVVSSFDSIYYLTGVGFEPLERPFFLLVRPDRPPVLLVPKLDYEHMKKAHNISVENVHTYWDYPAVAGRSWPDRLREHISDARQVGIEPTLRQEIAQQLHGHAVRVEPLVERLRVLKSAVEIQMIRRAARYADFGVKRLLAASYFGSTVAEGFVETRTVTTRIIREADVFEPLTTRVIMATWAAPHSAKPHSIPDLNDRLGKGPHVALVLTRVNGYAAESERTYFTKSPTPDERKAFAAMTEARRIAFDLIRPGLSCSELDGRVNDFLRKEGYGEEDQRLHRLGHGLGLGNHEAPWVAEGSEDRLAENMVISVEPGIYLRDVGGFRHSDTVLVTKDGHKLLTRYPMDLDSLVIEGWKPWARITGLYVRCKLRLAHKASRAKDSM